MVGMHHMLVDYSLSLYMVDIDHMLEDYSLSLYTVDIDHTLVDCLHHWYTVGMHHMLVDYSLSLYMKVVGYNMNLIINHIVVMQDMHYMPEDW